MSTGTGHLNHWNTTLPRVLQKRLDHIISKESVEDALDRMWSKVEPATETAKKEKARLPRLHCGRKRYNATRSTLCGACCWCQSSASNGGQIFLELSEQASLVVAMLPIKPNGECKGIANPGR